MSDSPSPIKVNTPEFWEAYMAEQWDANSGRQQTRLFAKYFLDAVQLPKEAKTLLDVSCAKGDGMPEFHARYPNLKLVGQDISELAIQEAQKSYGEIAEFRVAGFEDISEDYDVIFCSNTLEHFENYLEIAEGLLKFCTWLYILVPYRELRRGTQMIDQHVATFDKRSFDTLLKRGAASGIRHWVRYTPGAWGSGPVTWRQWLRALVKKRRAPIAHRQIFFEVRSHR
jgi:cyclopropane fatty-acyl-phospholipid synthase-like methyltransferase